MTVRITQGLVAMVLTLTTLAVDRQAWAGPPTDQLRAQMDRIVKVLEDPDLKRDGHQTERRTAIRRMANEIFDFTETTRRSLGQRWHPRTAQEREEIVRIQFLGDTTEGDQATARTRLITKAGAEIPMDYRMHRVGADRWLTYDVAIEGVSNKALVRKLTAKREEGLEADRELTIRKASETK